MENATIKPIIDVIAQQFKKCGYEHVRVNIWQQRRVYVIVSTAHTQQVTFCYELDNDLHIWSKEILPRDVYRDAKKITSMVQKHQEQLMSEPSNYYVTCTTVDIVHS